MDSALQPASSTKPDTTSSLVPASSLCLQVKECTGPDTPEMGLRREGRGTAQPGHPAGARLPRLKCVCSPALMSLFQGESSLPRMPLRPACLPGRGRQQHPAGRGFPAAWELLEGEGFLTPSISGTSWECSPGMWQARKEGLAWVSQGKLPTRRGWVAGDPPVLTSQGQGLNPTAPTTAMCDPSDISLSLPHWLAGRSE